jgi:hypothetical protein
MRSQRARHCAPGVIIVGKNCWRVVATKMAFGVSTAAACAARTPAPVEPLLYVCWFMKIGRVMPQFRMSTCSS